MVLEDKCRSQLQVRKRKARRATRERRLLFEPLEDRDLLAVVGQGFTLNAADLAFIVDQAKIAEAHAASITVSNPNGTLIGTGPNQIPAGPNAELLPLGLRTIDGRFNNLVSGQEDFGAADRPFPRLTVPYYRDAENLTFDPDGPGGQQIGDPTSYDPITQPTGVIEDSQPRLISNLIVDQTTSNPAAVAAAGPGAVPDPVTDALFIPNVAPDEGLSAPFNNTFVFFGQFFDHGLDLTTKSGSPVFMPLQPDDPLYVMGGPNFMLLSRATNDINVPINKDTPYVDQQQTYGSHPSLNVFLREYENDATLKPVSTGRLVTTPGVGGMANWTAIKAQTAGLLGIQLVDQDVFNIPLLATDPYGRFLRGPNGYPQMVLDDSTLLEGDPAANGGLGVLVPANSVSTGFAFLVDIAHSAVPGTWDHDSNPATPRVPQTPDALPGTADDGLPGTYDDEMLGAHFIAGDGRVNENIGLTAVHHVFHSEHNRLVQHIKDVLTAGDPADLAEYQLSPGVWNGERLFQAARFVTEMEYQHLAFEEFARKVQPQINVFDAYDATIDAAITTEFSQAVYRFGHSMLTETLSRINGTTSNNIDLLDAFLNPPAFFDGGVAGTLTPDEGAGSLFQGLSTQVANEIDPFVTEALRNTLVGLPLDLAAINIARGRDFGIPPLNQTRRELFAATQDTAVQPYDNWIDFGMNLEVPEGLVNYIAAYGTHPTITGATTVAAKRAAADILAADTTSDFMNSLNTYASVDGVTTTGVDDIDLWVGGLGEKSQPFGGILGDTMNKVFEMQLENLQEGDRFYYLSRTAGMNLLVQLEGNSFSELISRNTTATNLPADVFSTADLFFDAAVQGSVPGTPIVDDLNTPYDETLLLVRETDGTIRFTGAEHVNWAGDDSALPGEGDRIRSGAGDDTLQGAGGDDRLEGGAGNDSIIGGLGNDILTDLFGDDDIKGGDGNDAISSGQGFDLLQGGRGSDFIVGATDPKEILGGAGNDFLFDGDATGDNQGNDGDDWIEGGLQGDVLEGDTGLPILLGVDVNTPGHDVLNGNEGNDRYFGEGGDDILISGTGLERFLGQFGHDWVTHYNDPQPADSDLLNDVFAVPVAPVIVDFDRFNGVEGLSGWNLDDSLHGDHLGTLELLGTIDGSHELDAAGIARISGLAALLPPGTTSFTGGNIIIGGGGSDILEGRGGDDIIDGDAWLRAQLLAPDPAGPPGATQLVDSMRALQEDVFAGLIDPGDISIVRSIETTRGGTDTAVFSGPLADYDITVNGDGSFTVDHVRGDGLSTVLFPSDPTLDNGTDTVRNVERLQFADQTIAVAGPLYFSVQGTTTLGGLSVANEDIVAYSGTDFSLLFDGSDVGLGGFNINSFAVISSSEILMSFTAAGTVGGLSVDDSDIVLFTGSSLGNTTAGSFSMYFDGSDVGLTSNGEDINAFELLDNGHLLISTTGFFSGSGAFGADEDVFEFTPTSLGAATSGSFSIYFDGSDVGLGATSEDVDALGIDSAGRLYLSTLGDFSAGGVSGADEDVATFVPASLGPTTSGSFAPTLFFDGSVHGLASNDVNAIDLPLGLVDTTSPNATVTAPNGGQNWATGSLQNITWNATDNIGVTSVDLLYSTNGGGSYLTIATDEANDGVFAWTVPGSPTSNALVKVVAHDAAGNSGEDVSDAAFRISDQTNPSVTVTAPNGGQNWSVGSVQNITWSATDNIGVTLVDLFYSTNGGGSYMTIATGETNDGSFSWTIPNAPTTNALVKVVANDAAANSAEDVSNAAFTISVPDTTVPIVTVTAPNGGQNWATGSLQNITWNATDNIGVTSVDLLYSTNGGGSYMTIATGESNDGSFSWTVPDTPSTNALVKVVAHDGAANSAEDVSNAAFTISDQTAPSVTVLAPNGGETWVIGTSQIITWNATDNIGVTSVDLFYSTNGGGSYMPIATGETNDGSFSWTVPNAPTTNALVKVVANDTAANSAEDVSNAAFTIADVSTAMLYFSLQGSGSVGGVSVANEDIIAYSGTDFSLLFDGSDVGLGGFNINAFAVISSSEILMSFTAAGTVGGLSVDDSDIVLFTGSSLGDTTAGSFSMYFDGSDVSLTLDREDIDAVELLDNGHLLISTTGSFSGSGASGADEDVFEFTPTSLGAATSGSFSIYFDGSDIGLSDRSEDVDAFGIDSAGRLYLSTQGDFSTTVNGGASGVSGADEDVATFAPTSLGSTTSGNFAPTLFFDGSVFGLGGNDVNAIDLPAIGGALTQTAGLGIAAGFNDGNRWSTTTTSGRGLGQGDPTTVTWSIVPDGTSIFGYNGEGTSPSDLRAKLDGIYGSISTWLPLFEQSFARLSELSGVNYVYESNDDGSTWASTHIADGQLGVRGDVRIAGHNIDGNSGSLAYNFFPNFSDMVLDTGDMTGGSPFYGSTFNNSIRLRNVIMHEGVHGLGVDHVESNNAQLLMEPFISTSFDGPQFGDILAMHRGYGDVNEFVGNDSSASATSLGSIGDGQTVTIGADANDAVVAASDVDLVSIDDNSDTDFYSFAVSASSTVNLTLTPLGPTYNQGPQGGSQTSFNAQSQSDLALAVFDTNGASVLDSANANGIGAGETLSGVSLSRAGQYYVRVTGAQNAAQMYQLEVTVNAAEAAMAPAPDVTPPTWTGGVVTASNATNTTVDLAWSGAGGADEDVMVITAHTVGSSTRGIFATPLFFDGGVFGLGGHGVNAIDSAGVSGSPLQGVGSAIDAGDTLAGMSSSRFDSKRSSNLNSIPNHDLATAHIRDSIYSRLGRARSRLATRYDAEPETAHEESVHQLVPQVVDEALVDLHFGPLERTAGYRRADTALSLGSDLPSDLLHDLANALSGRRSSS